MKIKAEDFKNVLSKALLIPVDMHLSDFAGDIKLFAENNKFVVVVCNIKGMGIKVEADCEGDLPQIAVNALKLKGIANNINSYKETKQEELVKTPLYIELILKESKLTIKHEKSKHNLVTKDGKNYDEYLSVLDKDASNSCEVTKEFTESIKRLSHVPNPKALHQEEISVGIINNEIMATDNWRIAVIKTQIEGTHNIRIPLDTIKIMESLETTRIWFTKEKIQIEGEDFVFVSRLNEGENPNYQGIVSEQLTNYIVTNRQGLINVVKNVLPTLDTLLPRVKVTIEKDKITFMSSEEIGNSTEVEYNPAEISSDDNYEFFFNGNNFLSMLNFFKEESVKIMFPNKGSKQYFYIKAESEIYLTTMYK